MTNDGERQTERRLLEAVLADVADDAARLVYADSLLQRREAQGELIVAQCLLAAEGRKAEAYRRARTREHALLSQNQHRWMKRAGVRSGPKWPHAEATFRRGFVTEAAMTFFEVRDQSARLQLVPLEHLRVVPGRVELCLGDLRWLAAQPFGARLRRLTVRIPRCDVTLDAQAAFVACRARQKADHGPIWGDRFSAGFLHPFVTDLVLDGARAREHVDVDFLTGFVLPPRLERLGIVDGHHLEPTRQGLFERLAVDPRAGALASVSFAQLSVESARTLLARWPFMGARRLHLGVEEGAALLAGSGALAKLEAFSTMLPIDRALTEALAPAPLEELSAMGGITDEVTPLFAAPALHTLRVDGGTAPPLLDMLERPRALSSLRLERIAFDDDDAERLASMPSLGGLFELHVVGSGLSEEGAYSLLRSTTLADVPWLDLGEVDGHSSSLLRERIRRSPGWSANLTTRVERT